MLQEIHGSGCVECGGSHLHPISDFQYTVRA
jgi:hypothetical protein